MKNYVKRYLMTYDKPKKDICITKKSDPDVGNALFPFSIIRGP